jgi:hypothetical protein
MRTTLTLDPDVADALKEQAGREDKPFKQIVNDLLRRGMSLEKGQGAKGKPFRVKPHRGGFKPGVDLLKLNQLADDLEVDDFVADKAGGKGS